MDDNKQEPAAVDDAIRVDEESREGGAQEGEAERRPEGKLSFESELSTDEALNYLVSLIRGIKGGKVTLRQGDETIALEPSGTMAVKVKAASKGRKEKLSFELSWRLPSEDELEIE